MTATEYLKDAVWALRAGELDRARAAADAALDESPRLGAAHLVAGRIELEKGRPAPARDALRRATACDPNSAECHSNLGVALERCGDVRDAYNAHVRALELAPDAPAVQLRAARFLAGQGELDVAETLLEQTLKPGTAGVAASDAPLALWIDVRLTRGDLSGACDLVVAHTDVIAEGYESSLAAARSMRAIGSPAQAADLLSTVAQGSLDPSQRARVGFSMGDAYDEAGDAKRAFEAWSRAHRSRPFAFDASVLEEVERTLAAPVAPANANVGQGLVVVVGDPASARDAVAHQLSLHPNVERIGRVEGLLSHTVEHALEPAPAFGVPYQEVTDPTTPRSPRRLATLRGDALALGSLLRHAPGTHVVACDRDSADSALAMFAHDLRERAPWSEDLATSEQVLDLARRAREHWSSAGGRLDVLEHEALRADPEGGLRVVSANLGLTPGVPIAREALHAPSQAPRTVRYAHVL